MARVPKSDMAMQLFAGGEADLSKNVWVQNLGNCCCGEVPTIDQDRLNPTINPENALIHTRPFGNRMAWHYGDIDDSQRRRIVKHINTKGVGAQLEILTLPTFGLLYSVQVVTLAEETGLVFEMKTRNGTVIPSGQQIKVSESDGVDTCGEVTRVKGTADKAALGVLDTANRVHDLFVSGTGGEFILDADVIILEVKSLPADGVKGEFDLLVHINYVAPGRSEAPR